MHWPEAQVLIASDAAHRGKQSGIPDYNAVVRVVPLGATRERSSEVRRAKPKKGYLGPWSRRPPGEPRSPVRKAPPPPDPQPPGSFH